MDLKEIKKVFENSDFFSKIFIEDDFEISGLINLWNRNDIDISIEFNPDYADDIDFYKTSLNLIEENLNWINENKKLICKRLKLVIESFQLLLQKKNLLIHCISHILISI